MAERLELIKTVDKIHLCSSILSSHSSLTGAKTIKIQIKMKQNFKLFATLAASAAMMISCQQAEEPTMDKAQEPLSSKHVLTGTKLRRSPFMSRPTT
jgi:hypothetical protein